MVCKISNIGIIAFLHAVTPRHPNASRYADSNANDGADKHERERLHRAIPHIKKADKGKRNRHPCRKFKITMG